MTRVLWRPRIATAVFVMVLALLVLAGSPTASADHPVWSFSAGAVDAADPSEFDEALADLAPVDFAVPLLIVALLVVLVVASPVLTVRDRGPPSASVIPSAVTARWG